MILFKKHTQVSRGEKCPQTPFLKGCNESKKDLSGGPVGGARDRGRGGDLKTTAVAREMNERLNLQKRLPQ